MGLRQARKRVSRVLLGSPLPTSAAQHECLPNAQAMAVLLSPALRDGSSRLFSRYRYSIEA